MQNLRDLSNIAENLIRHMENKPAYLDIFLKWEEVVGEYNASICRPLKVVNVGKDKLLILKTIKGRGLEIQHSTDQILGIINGFTKNKTFSQIKVVQTDNDKFED